MLAREGEIGSERMAWAADDALRAAHADFLEGVEVLQRHGWFDGFTPRRVLYLLVGAALYAFLVPGEIAAIYGEDAATDDFIADHADAVVRLFMAHAPKD